MPLSPRLDGARLRDAVSNALEEAEMFQDMTSQERAEAARWLSIFPDQMIAAIGQAFRAAAKEVQR
jgi:hypothetical protein